MTGVSPDTVRYYERRGLLPRVPGETRTATGRCGNSRAASHGRQTRARRGILDQGAVSGIEGTRRGRRSLRQVLAIGRDRLGDLERRIEQLIALRDDSRSC